MEQLTGLLDDWNRGDTAARERLFELVYGELRRLAAGQMKHEATGHTLTPTALVHEVYLRLAKDQPVAAADRRHFYAIASNIMRRVLVDYARRRLAAKRGSGEKPAAWQDHLLATEADALESVQVHEAIETLSALDPRQARIIEMRYFGGLTAQETAEALSLCADEVDREWRLAKLWLRQRLG